MTASEYIELAKKNKAKKPKQQLEYQLQVRVANFLNEAYPNLLFMSDTIAAAKLTHQQAQRNKAIQKDDFHCPDLIIFEKKGNFGGLFIELKKDSPYKKDKTLYANEHLEDQQRTINDLRAKGYFACFGYEYSQICAIINDYLKTDSSLHTKPVLEYLKTHNIYT